MDVIRKQEVLPALPKLDSFEPKLFCDRTRHSSLSGTESWRENLRYLADSIPDRGKLSHRDSNVLLNRQGTQNLSQRSSISSEHKMEELSRNIDLSRVLSEHSVSPWSKANIDCMHDVHPTDKDGERRGNGSKRNIVHEDSELSFPSKLPSFQTLNAIGGQKEEILSHQGRCFAPEAATKTAGICSPPTVDRNGLGQRNDNNNSYKTSSSDEYPSRQQLWNELVRARNSNCMEPSLGSVISDEQRRLADSIYSMGTSFTSYEEPHPLVMLRSTEGLTQEQKQMRRILKNRWSAKMSRIKRNEQIRRLELKSNEQEKMIQELLEERDRLRNEVSLLRKQMEQQQSM